MFMQNFVQKFSSERISEFVYFCQSCDQKSSVLFSDSQYIL